MTEDEYYQWFRACGYEPTGAGTELSEEWSNPLGTTIYITRANELTAADRAAAVERYKMYLGIGYPPHGHGVH